MNGRAGALRIDGPAPILMARAQDVRRPFKFGGPEVDRMIPLLREAGLAELVDPEGVEVATLATGFEFTEGPLWLPDGSLLFQDLKTERTHRLGPDGAVEVLRERTGAANGQTWMPGGRIVFCEQNGRRVSTMNPDGSGVATLVDSYRGDRLNSPNDVICRSDGLVVFTDPPYGVKAEDRSLAVQGVYAIRPDGSDLRLLVDDFQKPNGLAFSPDERTLYVCDTGRYHVRAFDVKQDGSLAAGTGRIFAELDPGRDGGPDGMKVDRSGRVYVAVALGVWVFEPDGRLLGIIATANRPSNLAWAGADARDLAITAVDRVHRVRLVVEGCRPPFQPVPA